MTRQLSFAAFALIATVGCRSPRTLVSLDADQQLVVDGHNDFAVELYQASSAYEGNVFLSPFSITAGLSMVYAGAEGDTETQIADAMGVVDEDVWHETMGALVQDLSGNRHRGYTLHTANAVWGQDSVPFQEAFSDRMADTYGAPIEEIDFASDPEGARQEINGWVADNTDDIIQDAFAAGDIHTLTRMVLANAVFFQADWASQFDEDDTQDRDFTLASGESVQVPTMCQETEVYGHFAWDTEGEPETSVLRMPYEDEELSFIAILPGSHDGLAELEADLTGEALDSLIADTEDREEAWVCLPRFEVDYELPLIDVLVDVGIEDLFDAEAADLTGITAQENMADNYYVDVARHRAYVEVNEQGTRAAAFTGFAVADKGGGASFVADHPFLYLIRDDLTGTILFMGRMEDPR